jgi:hypothetical protein
MQVEVKGESVPRLRRSDNVGNCAAVGPTGLKAQTASSKNISRMSLQNCRSLGFARDDKG